ncbi:50S ribosomal protein L5 [Candidatus Parcubacteria bacterium]|nr:MAG: 50S ribosomal protein L5 [Candidatus Parcubacteria bacterium]
MKELYTKEVLPKLVEKFQYKNNLEAPKLQKVVLNVGFGRHSKEKDYIKNVENTLSLISGQKPVLTKARMSVSSFKVREGMTIGAKVTLRGEKMYDFLDKLINVTFPRVRDFRGITNKGIDRTGNITIGFKENSAFPEVRVEELEKLHGLEVCISTSAKTRDEGLELFTLLGFPFVKDNK